MTAYEILSLIISIAGSVGVIATLWVMNRQTSIFSRQLMEGLSQSVTNYSLEISRLFLEHPDLRPYFFEGQSIDPKHPDYLRAEAVAEVILDIIWTMGSEAKRIQGYEFANAEARVVWETYIGDFFASSPLLTSFLTRRKDWYGQEMVDRMEKGLARARQQAS